MGKMIYEMGWLQGLSHRKKNIPCQDAVQIKVDEASGRLAAAVADGLGSLPHSQIASRTAVDVMTDWLCTQGDALLERGPEELEETLRGGIMQRLAQRIAEDAVAAGYSFHSMDCNLAFVLVSPEKKVALCGSLGDGAICILNENPHVLSESGGSASGTATILSEHAGAHLQIELLELTPKFHGFVLASDGLEGELYRKNSTKPQKAVERYFNAILRQRPILERMLEQLQKDPSFDDDLSIAVVSLNGKPIKLADDILWHCVCGNDNPLTASYCLNCHRDFYALFPTRYREQFPTLEDAVLARNQEFREREAQEKRAQSMALPEAPAEPPVQQATNTRRWQTKKQEPENPHQRGFGTGSAEFDTESVDDVEQTPKQPKTKGGKAGTYQHYDPHKKKTTPNSQGSNLRGVRQASPVGNSNGTSGGRGKRKDDRQRQDRQGHPAEEELSRTTQEQVPMPLFMISIAINVILLVLLAVMLMGAAEDKPSAADPQEPSSYGFVEIGDHIYYGKLVDGQLEGTARCYDASDYEKVTFRDGELVKVEAPPTTTPSEPKEPEPTETTAPSVPKPTESTPTIPPESVDVPENPGTPTWYCANNKAYLRKDYQVEVSGIQLAVSKGTLVQSTGRAPETYKNITWVEIEYQGEYYWINENYLEPAEQGED